MNESNNIENKFKNVFSDFEPEVNNSVWENVKAELHPAKKRILWWQWAAAAIFISAIVSTYMLWQKPEKEITAFKTNKNNFHYYDKPTKDLHQNNQNKEINSQPATTTVHKENKTQKEGYAVAETNNKDEVKKAHSTTNKNNNLNRYASKIFIHENKDEKNLSISEEKILALPPAYLILKEIPKEAQNNGIVENITNDNLFVQKTPQINQWSLSASIHSVGGSNSSSSQKNEESLDPGIFSTPLKNSPSTTDNSTYESDTSFTIFTSATGFTVNNVFSPAGESINDSLKGVNQTKIFPFNTPDYQPPLTTSITINYHISKRWSVESGVAYTILKSKSETPTIDNEKIELDVTLHYIGIPFIASFDILSRKRIMLYSSAGIMADKGISAKYELTRYIREEMDENTTKKSPIKDIQIAGIMGLGMDYKINKWFSYYVQPGVKMYFVTAEQLYNIQSKQIFWPSLHIGLKINL